MDIHLIIGIILGALIGGLLIYFWRQTIVQTAQSMLGEKQQRVLQLENQLQIMAEDMRQENTMERLKSESLIKELARTSSENENLTIKLSENKQQMLELEARFTKEFENLANKILEEKGKKFSEQNELQLKSILDPLKEKIQNFEKNIHDNHKESEKERSALKEQLRSMVDMNKRMSDEALNLTRALKGDNKKQGNWGELILERILEKSGLRKGVEYDVQQNFQQEDGTRVQPDVLIKLPDQKNLVVDSKVSLNAYDRYVATDDADNVQQAIFLKEHILSLRTHIKSLSSKNYQNIYNINSPDFVMLFIPIESAFSLAISHDDEIYLDAFDKNIILVCPSTLLATLRTVANVWKQEYQSQNAIDIAKYGADMYDKFVNFVEDLKKIGGKLKDAQNAYEDAEKKLYEGKGNLVRRAEHMKQLGLKAQKQLPPEIVHKSRED